MKKMKHFIATVLSLGIILTSSLMAVAAEPIRQSVAEINPHTQSETDVYFVLGDGVRVRQTPGLSASNITVGLLYENRNDWVEVRLDNTRVVDGLNWYQVVDSSTGVTGWIAGMHLNIASPRTVVRVTYIK